MGCDKRRKLEKPPIRCDRLNVRNIDAVHKLLQGEQCKEDGLRFETMQGLNDHLDFLFARNKNMVTSRAWHSTWKQWETDFGSLGQQDASGDNGADSSASNGTGSGGHQPDGPHLVAVGSLNLERCPISGEQLEQSYDEGRQCMIYEDAGLVLVPHNAVATSGSNQLGSMYESLPQVDGVDASLLRLAVMKWFMIRSLLAKGDLLGFEDAVGLAEKDKDLAQALVEVKEGLGRSDPDASVFVYNFGVGEAVSEAK